MLINCSECGKQVSDKATCCPNCGNPISSPSAEEQTKRDQDARRDQFFERIERIERESYERELRKSGKARLAFVLLGLCLGVLGIHNFYVGKSGKGICQIMLALLAGFFYRNSVELAFLTFVILVIWILVDICSTTCDAEGKFLS